MTYAYCAFARRWLASLAVDSAHNSSVYSNEAEDLVDDVVVDAVAMAAVVAAAAAAVLVVDDAMDGPCVDDWLIDVALCRAMDSIVEYALDEHCESL